jgi:hypothetical protein
MKHALFTMIGLAALSLPASSQQLPPVIMSDASLSPQVEIPEGAFEIALPNLGTKSVELPTERPAELQTPSLAPAPRVIIVQRTERTTRVRNCRRAPDARRVVRIIETNALATLLADNSVSVGNGAPKVQSVSTAPMPSAEMSESSGPQPGPPSGVEALTATNAGYSLASAAPNPVSATASISFTLPRAGRTTLSVFDNSGRVVATLADGMLDAGTHTRVFDASGLPAGLYLYRLSSGSYAETKTMTVVR